MEKAYRVTLLATLRCWAKFTRCAVRSRVVMQRENCIRRRRTLKVLKKKGFKYGHKITMTCEKQTLLFLSVIAILDFIVVMGSQSVTPPLVTV